MLYWLSIIRSYIFCFRYMSRKVAICCPILIYWNTKCYISPKARIRINVLGGKCDIKIGVWGGSYGLRQGKTRFCVFDDSMVIFNGKACISKGSNVVVRQGATLSFGQDFFCNANCNILANKEISFGDSTLMGWNITVLDNDGHPHLLERRSTGNFSSCSYWGTLLDRFACYYIERCQYSYWYYYPVWMYYSQI